VIEEQYINYIPGISFHLFFLVFKGDQPSLIKSTLMNQTSKMLTSNRRSLMMMKMMIMMPFPLLPKAMEMPNLNSRKFWTGKSKKRRIMN